MSVVDITTPPESDEGTTMKVQAWLKQPGDSVTKNEPIVEMETDKVTLEIEAPVDGILSEILAPIDADVLPDMVIGRINTEQDSALLKAPKKETIGKVIDTPKETNSPGSNNTGLSRNVNTALSPSVRRFLMQHNITDVAAINGTGRRNRITLSDVKQYWNNLASEEVDAITQANTVTTNGLTNSTTTNPGIVSQRIPHSSMRRTIAEHMSTSVRDAPHVTAVFEADFSAIKAHRAKHKDDFAARGVKLTYTAYVLMACANAMKAVPEINSRWHVDAVEIFSDINIGVGTALGENGLVVPVIKGLQERSLFGVAKELQDMTNKARDNKLQTSDVRGGTFTISNHGVSGSLVATPIIINQPQSAILGVGKLEKRVVVRSLDGQDVMLIKPMAYVSLTIDHRVIDGYQTNAWLTEFVSTLEHWPDTEK